MAAVGSQELLVDIAREQIRGRDRHDRGRHQGADSDRCERDADEPGRKHLQQQRGHREVVLELLESRGVLGQFVHAGGDRHEAQ